MTSTANLVMPEMTESQASKYLTHNESLWIIDALLQSGVIDKDLTAPPGSPTAGDVYIVGPSATGDWSGQDDDIAYYANATWKFLTPNEGWSFWVNDENVRYVWDGAAWVILDTESIIIIVGPDETTALTTGTAKMTFRMPYAFTLFEVRASLTTAPVGSVFTVDINETATTILSTKLTIDATEKTSTTAATPVVISDAALADDAEMTIDIDAIGSGTAGAGLKITLIGTRAI